MRFRNNIAGMFSRISPPADTIIYTDAATSTMIMAIILISLSKCQTSKRLFHCCGIRASGAMIQLFPDTSQIYGLELTALVLTVADPRIPLDNSRITRYVDNNNILRALIKADCCRVVISGLTRLFWDICAVWGITHRLERVGIDVNISDIPTRGDEFPFGTDLISDFQFGEQLLKMVSGGIKALTGGYFDPELLVGRLYRHVYARAGEGRT